MMVLLSSQRTRSSRAGSCFLTRWRRCAESDRQITNQSKSKVSDDMEREALKQDNGRYTANHQYGKITERNGRTEFP